MGFTLATLLAFAPLVLAKPLEFTRVDDTAKIIDIRYRHDKVNDKYSLAVLDKGKTEFLGRKCATTIDTGAFAKLPVTVNANERASGTIVVGDYTYPIGGNSHHINCWSMYNDQAATLTCHVRLRDYESWDAAAAPVVDDCGLDNFLLVDQDDVGGEEFNATLNAPLLKETIQETGNSKLEARCQIKTETRMVGNGNPHQNYLNIQLTETKDCSSQSCHVGREETNTVTWGWQASGSVAGWISGGFSVEKSRSTGNYYECDGGAGQKICVWYKAAYTAYTVQNWHIYSCGGFADRKYGPEYIIWSPNKDNAGGGPYCVAGTCRNINSQWWDHSPSTPGGPP